MATFILGLVILVVGAVLIYTSDDIAATQVFGFDGSASSVSTWVIYGVIFAYYLIATVFPIDAVIGRIYPIFGAILLFSAVGVFGGIFFKGYPLVDVWQNVWMYEGVFNYSEHFAGGLIALLGIKQDSNAKRLSLSAIIFALVAVILVFAKTNAQCFNVPWTPAYVAGVVLAVAYCAVILWYGKKRGAAKTL